MQLPIRLIAALGGRIQRVSTSVVFSNLTTRSAGTLHDRIRAAVDPRGSAEAGCGRTLTARERNALRPQRTEPS